MGIITQESLDSRVKPWEDIPQLVDRRFMVNGMGYPTASVSYQGTDNDIL